MAPKAQAVEEKGIDFINMKNLFFSKKSKNSQVNFISIRGWLVLKKWKTIHIGKVWHIAPLWLDGRSRNGAAAMENCGSSSAL
jgi:hypothetical protein